MKLNSLELRNFKGIKELKIMPEGNNLNICGDNGTGKTTVFDAFMWLLFDKDSSNSSNFNIKTLDKSGEAVSGVEHEVKGIIEANGKIIELQKIYKEKWNKRRGETEQTLTGHTTDYFIDGVPKLKKEYTELLKGIIDEETFRILTNPLHFNTQLEWKKRREVAMDLVDQIENEEVLKGSDKLKGLEELLVGDITAEDLKAKTIATKRKLNAEVKQIPVRIDEISRQDIDEDIVFSAVEESKEKLAKEIEDTKIGTVDTEQIEKLKEEVVMLEASKRAFERDKTVALNKEYKSINEKIQVIQKEINSTNQEKQKIENETELFNNKISLKERDLKRFRAEYKEINDLEFDKESNTCNSCGQDLQEDKKEENLVKFDELKLTQINKNIELGKTTKAEVDSLKMEIENNNEKVSNLIVKLKQREELLESLNTELTDVEKQIESIDFNEFKEYKECSTKIDELNGKIENILTTNKNESQEQQNKLKELEEELSKVNTLLSKKEVIESNTKRVEELKEEERELSEQIAQLEKVEMQCEQFIVTKAELVEERLNNKFTLVKFKLFNEQMNGGVDETFVTTVNGVPFEDLNNAMKINAGLDIISTLTKHYKFNPTIFIDNRESVTEIIEMDSQIINLIVSNDKELTIKDNKTKEVA